MTDYKEEQVNEIEALESIYPDELTGKIIPSANRNFAPNSPTYLLRIYSG